MCQSVIRRPFNHSESCQPLDGSFPIGAPLRTYLSLTASVFALSVVVGDGQSNY